MNTPISTSGPKNLPFVVLEILEGREDFRQRSGIEDILMQSTDGMMEAESAEVRERVYV